MSGVRIDCIKCLWWNPIGLVEEGQCRKDPPVATNEISNDWPITDCDGWCGRGCPKEETDDEKSDDRS